jgi:hypothetical protein
MERRHGRPFLGALLIGLVCPDSDFITVDLTAPDTTDHIGFGHNKETFHRHGKMADATRAARSIAMNICRSGRISLDKFDRDQPVDIDAKSPRNLLCDAGTANTGIAALEFDDRIDELLRWPFWSGAPMTSGMTASLAIRLAGTNSDQRPKTKRSNELRFGARRRARLLMTNWYFSNTDSATTARTPSVHPENYIRA